MDTVGEAEVFGVKRVRSQGEPVDVPINKNPRIAPALPVNQPLVPPVTQANLPLVPPVTQPTLPLVPPVTQPIVQPATPVKQRRKRAKPRRLPVPTRTLNVWERLRHLDSGLTMLDWVAIDRDAAKDLTDGLRDLRVQRPKRTKKHLAALATGTGLNQGARVNVVDNDQDLYSDGYGSGSDSDYSGYDSEESGSVTSGASSLNSELVVSNGVVDRELSDVESVYQYPYHLNKMKVSSPLRGIVSINGQAVEAIFDTGASVSVISKNLADALGLVPNGDSLHLIGFNNKKTPTKSDVVMNVPIVVAGKLRPDHMCIADGDNGDKLCLLGIQWLQNYGIELSLTEPSIKIPTTSGMVKLSCYTTHLPMATHVGVVDAVSGAGCSEVVDEDCSCVVGAGCSGVRCSGEVAVGVQESLNDRFAALKSRQKEVYHVGIAQKYTETLEEDLGTEEKPAKIAYTVENIAEGAPDILVPLIQEYKHIFSEVSGLTRIKGYRMNIYLKEGAVPVKARPFRLGWEDQDTMDKYIDEMLELDLIEKATGIFSSPSFLIDKRDGSKRCVIDYRKLNKLILCTNFPTPTVAELTEACAGATVFTSCDCTSGYHQLELNPDHAEYTAFVTNRGVFKYKVLPMGISPGCSEFQRVVSDIFRDYIGKFSTLR